MEYQVRILGRMVSKRGDLEHVQASSFRRDDEWGEQVHSPCDNVKGAADQGRTPLRSRPPLHGHSLSIHLSVRRCAVRLDDGGLGAVGVAVDLSVNLSVGYFGKAVGKATGSLHDGGCAFWEEPGWAARLRVT